VEKACHEDDNELIIRRRRIASLNTWDDRVKQISVLIRSTLNELQKAETQ
jgi:hypothetical protein